MARLRVMRSSQDPVPTQPASFYARHSGSTQRARLLDAVTRVVAEKGFSGATVSDIVTAAGVSRTTFYEHFDGKQHCMLAAFATATEIVLSASAEAVREVLHEGWRAALGAGLGAYFDVIRAEPATARMIVEVRTLGADGITASAAAQARHVGQIVRLATRLASNGGQDIGALTPGLRLVIAGIEEQVAQALQLGNPGLLDEIESTAVDLLGAIGARAGLTVSRGT